MNYELAKELKDAGFPQEDVWDFTVNDLCSFAYNETDELHLLHNDNDEGGKTGNDYLHREEDKINWVKCPTLSELIEACGDGFWRFVKAGKSWTAEGAGELLTFGLSPEEAVARLWLELNKK